MASNNACPLGTKRGGATACPAQQAPPPMQSAYTLNINQPTLCILTSTLHELPKNDSEQCQ